MPFSWSLVVSEADEGRLLRDLLRGKIGISQRLLHALKFQGTISLNGAAVTVRARVKSGDRILLCLPDQDQERVEPEALPLRLVYEDQDLLVVDKPAGMIVHPVPPEPHGTLANAIAWHWQQQGQGRPVRLVTRLDRDTTGLVLVAKHALAQHFYAGAAERLSKHYLALIHCRPPGNAGMIDLPIGIDQQNAVARSVDERGKPAQTAWWLLETHADYSLVQAELLTGRTHQIRVHFAHLGHPLLGDRQYGGASPLIARQALHCARLALTHVRSGAKLVFYSPLPADMKNLCSGAAMGTPAEINPDPDLPVTV